jgi:potassium-transporting ATPase KdpC subunit
MLRQVRPALVCLILLTLVTGVAYPLAVTAVAKLCFPGKAAGSVVAKDGSAVGSRLIGQPFSDPKYFWSRPSTTSPVPYAGDAGAGSNLGPTNPALAEAVKQRVAALRAADPGNNDPVPVDLVTASGSGLDPHVSVAAARYQIPRVARARGLVPSDVAKLVDRSTEPRSFGIFGEPRVNVVELNLALDGK